MSEFVWKEKGRTKYNYPLKTLLVEKYIGKEVFEKFQNKQIRGILTQEALKQFQLEMIGIFGSLYNYQKDWIKRKGYKNRYEYISDLMQRNGFKSEYAYRDFCKRKKGYKNYQEFIKEDLRKKGYKNNYDYVLHLILKKGFKNMREWKEQKAIEKGFKDYSERRKGWVDKAYSEGRCISCFKKNENGKKDCDNCLRIKRDYYRRTYPERQKYQKEYRERYRERLREYSFNYRNNPEFKANKKEYDKMRRKNVA